MLDNLNGHLKLVHVEGDRWPRSDANLLNDTDCVALGGKANLNDDRFIETRVTFHVMVTHDNDTKHNLRESNANAVYSFLLNIMTYQVTSSVIIKDIQSGRLFRSWPLESFYLYICSFF